MMASTIIGKQEKIRVQTLSSLNLLLSTLFLVVVLSACAGSAKKPDEKEAAPAAPAATAAAPAAQTQNDELRAMLQNLNTRIDSLETKLGSLNEKVDQTKGRVDQSVAAQMMTPVNSPANSKKGISPEVAKRSEDPEFGFITDQAVTEFRRGMILFEGSKYPEAVLQFTSFLEQFADHALAGNVQYYIGESYFRQKEYKLAAQEFQRVLTSYDRSPAISMALKGLVQTSDSLKNEKEASHYRQTLLSLFPQSPAAGELANVKISATPAPAAVSAAAAPTASGGASAAAMPETAPIKAQPNEASPTHPEKSGAQH